MASATAPRGAHIAAPAVLVWGALMARPTDLVLTQRWHAALARSAGTQRWLRRVEHARCWLIPYAALGYRR